MDPRKIYPNNPLMAGAWCDFILWASKDENIIGEFEKEGGIPVAKIISGRSALEKLIDETTGFEDEVAEKFTEWVTEKYWGPTDD